VRHTVGDSDLATEFVAVARARRSLTGGTEATGGGLVDSSLDGPRLAGADRARPAAWTPSCAATFRAGPIVAACRSLGDEAVREAHAEGVPPPTTASGGVRIEHELRYLIASA
jgi:hypothetical protein